MGTTPITNLAVTAAAASLYGRSTSKSPKVPRRYRLQHNHGHPIVNNQKKPGRNDPCPCGATRADGRPKKYKDCHGKPRQLPVSRDRPPYAYTGPQQPVTAEYVGKVTEAMRRANMPEEVVYAYSKVGLLVTEANRTAHHPDVVKQWDAAVDEYRGSHPGDKEATLGVADQPAAEAAAASVASLPADLADTPARAEGLRSLAADAAPPPGT